MGPNNKNDLPVVYVILARLDITKFESLEALLRHIVKFVMDGIGKREYSMVIDMSWANGEDLTKSLFNGTSALSDMNHALSREYVGHAKVCGVVFRHLWLTDSCA
jgi:hypothetical protein